MLTAAYAGLALKLQEAAAADLSVGDVQNRLRDALNDSFRGTGSWGYYLDHYGDSESGDVIYSCDGDTMRAPYEISGGSGSAAKCVIDTEHAEDVVPRTVYEPEADEDDHYAAMESAFKAEKLYGALPLYERFIAKSERDKATSGSFAGKGKSFPILKASDVSAAAHALGRAGSDNYDAGTIKKNIVRIAKEKGWESELPKAWRGGAKESAGNRQGNGSLRLTESAATVEAIVIKESRADYEIKLIAPGKGSSAFYPAEVLKRDGPKVFGAGTHVYLNHATAAEEAARPEGDVKNLAGVLTTQAEYHESHTKGPGLYARMKVFADHAQLVEEKAAHVGMSIRASGVAESGTKRDGLPVLKELTSAESVDVVTHAGAGGMILTEAAKPQSHQEDSMDATELKTLQEALAANAATNARLMERALRSDAITEGARILGSVSMVDALKTMVVENVLKEALPKTADGALDTAKFAEAVNAEAKRVGAAFSAASGGGRVFGMGSVAPIIDAKEAERKAADEKTRLEESVKTFKRLGMTDEAAMLAAKGRAA